MLKIIKVLFFLVFFSIVFSQTYANEKILILNYSKLNESNLNKLEISTKNQEIANIINDKINKKYYLEIIDIINENNIEIIIKYKWKSYIHNYIYTPKYQENLDISSMIKHKRIQNKPLSCELSVTADILTHLKWKNVTEDDILDKIDKTYFNKLPYTYENKLFWGNPNKWFVWYIDYYWENEITKPTQRDMTWYGVYEKPIGNVYKEYGLNYNIITKDNHNNNFTAKSHLTFLLKNLAKWNMIQLWGDWCTRIEYDDWTINKLDITQEKVDNKIYAKNYCTSTLIDRKIEWFYIEDYEIKKHIWLIWEHAFYLLWYEGWILNPKKIIVWDSDTGYHKYDIQEWMRKWSLMDYRSIIINKP